MSSNNDTLTNNNNSTTLGTTMTEITTTWIRDPFDAHTLLQIKLVLGIGMTLCFGLQLLFIQLRMEAQKSMALLAAAAQTQLQEEEEQTNGSSGSAVGGVVEAQQSHDDFDNNASGNSMMNKIPAYRLLHWVHWVPLFFTTAIIVLLTYLLLVFVPSGLWWSLLGLTAVVGVLLRQTIADEVQRRNRLDRLACMVTCILFVAVGLSLATYARLSLREGTIYRGAARIVGYDDTAYDNSAGDVLRTDLEVAFGGEWACPDTGKQCRAFVNGALCEAKQDDGDRRRAQRRRRRERGRRRRLDKNDDGDGNEDQDEGEEEEEEEEEELEEENEELEEENEELEEENEELEEYEEGEEEVNEEVEEDNEELEDYAVEEEEENEELEYEEEVLEEEVDELDEALEEAYEDLYYFDDDAYTDDYWNSASISWADTWGDYACYDLFETDMEGLEYDPDEPPGKDDDWPFVMIYGSCKTCDAYLLDYYSTEHFNQIKAFQHQAHLYFWAALLSAAVSAILVVKQRIRPAHEKEIELLDSGGGGGTSSPTSAGVPNGSVMA